MTVSVRGRVPSEWGEQTAAHITERLQALERATRGVDSGFVAPGVPAFGGGAVPGGGGSTVPPGGGGPGGGGGTTDHGALTGLLDDDHPQYVEQGDAVKPHAHGPYDVVGLEERFLQHGEHPYTPHTHGQQDILGLDQRQRVQTPPHAHNMQDIPDLNPTDVQFILAARIFGG